MKKIISMLKSNRSALIVFVSVIALLCVAILSYFLIDSSVCNWMLSGHTQMDNFTGSDLIKSLGKVYVPLWLLFLFGYAKKNLQLIVAACLSVLIGLVITGPLKIIAKRERPREVYLEQTYNEQGEIVKSNSDDQSFPSSDTAMVFAHAAVVTPLLSALSLPLLYILAAAVGVMRIFAFAHYPSDVLTGAAIGIFCGWLAIQISRRLVLENKFRMTEWWENFVRAAFVIIPVLTLISGGVEKMTNFSIASIILVAAFYLLNKIPKLLKKS